MRIAPLLLIAVAASCHANNAHENSELKEGGFEVTDTGLEQSTLYGPINVGVWLDNSSILLNALPDVPGAQEKHLNRVVRLNLETREVTPVLESGTVFCSEPNSEIFHIRQQQRFLFARIDAEGHFSPVSAQPASGEFTCKTAQPRFPDRLQAFLNEGDGYIDLGKTGGGFSEDNAVLYRPGLPPLELPIKGGEIVAGPVYLPFLNQYLLNYWDALSGTRKPAGAPAFRLMTPEGIISEIPQPKSFVKAVGSFGRAWLMRDGMVLNRTGPGRPKPGLYFVRDDEIIRAYGARGEIADRITPSPDGCKLAFLGMKNYDFITKKTVKIVDFCGAKAPNSKMDRDIEDARH